MSLLLPHHFKKIGAWLAPSGFVLWTAMQRGVTTRILTAVFGEQEAGAGPAPFHAVNVFIAVISFLGFLAGVYFLTFSKERKEDEMVQRTRSESFQFAALVQLACIIAGFLLMMVAGEPDEAGMMLFFVGAILLFWIAFIGRFNYVLHVRLRQ